LTKILVGRDFLAQPTGRLCWATDARKFFCVPKNNHPGLASYPNLRAGPEFNALALFFFVAFCYQKAAFLPLLHKNLGG
jgi:hypothetical protein